MTDEWTELRERTKAIWALGDYTKIARFFEPVADAIVDLCGVERGMEVLDVGAGSGNVAVAAARRGARVVGSDLSPAMIELGKQRSVREGLSIEWVEADAENLPFEEGRFDVVISVFGAMFAPRPDIATSEMFRVVREAGVVAMATWLPEGWSGQLFYRLARFAPPPPPGSQAPIMWGDPAVVRTRFERFASSVDFRRGTVSFDFPSMPEAMAFLETNAGSIVAARKTLPPAQYAQMKAELESLAVELNRGEGEEVSIPSEYLMVVARKARTG